MNRWSETFDNHPFQKHWNVFKSSLDRISLGAEVSSDIVDEYSRVKKVVVLIDSTIKSVDKDIFHLQTFDNALNFVQEAENFLNAFEEEKHYSYVNENHYDIDEMHDRDERLYFIQSINNQIDQILNLFRPYMIMPKAVAEAIKQTTLSQNKLLEDIKTAIIKTSQERLNSLNNSVEDAKKAVNEIEIKSEATIQLHKKLFGSDEKTGLSQEVEGFRDEIQLVRENSLEILNEIKSQQEDVIKNADLIERDKIDSQTNKDRIAGLLVETESEIDALKIFYTKVFGKEDEGEEGTLIGGLKKELENYNEEIIKYDSIQKATIKELTKDIKSLLPGALSAGLASAYRSLKEECDKPIKIFTGLFYLSLIVLIGVGTLGFIYAVKGEVSLEALIYNFLQASPIVIPAVWFAIFTSRRRNEFQRLRQEYAHKEAVTSSYQSFKQQIDELGEEQHNMLNLLLKTAIKTIEYNASHALDGVKQESSPLFEPLDTVINYAKSKVTRSKD